MYICIGILFVLSVGIHIITCSTHLHYTIHHLGMQTNFIPQFGDVNDNMNFNFM
jgi:hypothetical protein